MQGLRSRGLRGSPFRFKGLSYGATGSLSLTLGPLLAGWAWACTITSPFRLMGKPEGVWSAWAYNCPGFSHCRGAMCRTLGGARRRSPVVLL